MSPRRREVLAGAAAAVALALAGCSDGGSELNAPDDGETGTPTRTDPTPNLDIVGGMLPEFGDGTVSVDVTVENRGDEASSATLVVTAFNGEETREREAEVSLDPGEEETFTMEFDISRETYNSEEWGIRAELVLA